MIVLASQRSSLFIQCIFLCCASVIGSDYFYHACDSNVNYTSKSRYKTNLDTAKASLISAANTNNSGFYTASSVGNGPDKVNALVYCRDDMQPDICRSCVMDTMNKSRELCPSTKAADIWYIECVLRYSNDSIFNNVETWPTVYLSNPGNASDMDQFSKDLRNLLDKLKEQATQEKFASGDTRGPNFLTIYGLMKCSPDLFSIQRSNCLDGLMGYIQSCCSGKIGARIVNPSCQLRYETYIFYNETTVDAAC